MKYGGTGSKAVPGLQAFLIMSLQEDGLWINCSEVKIISALWKWPRGCAGGVILSRKENSFLVRPAWV